MTEEEHEWACANCGQTEAADPAEETGASTDLHPMQWDFVEDIGLVCFDCRPDPSASAVEPGSTRWVGSTP